MSSVNDLDAVPDRVFNGYLWPLGAWGVCLLFLFGAQRTPFALWLCFPLAVWYLGLTIWWGIRAARRHERHDLNGESLRAGVQSIGRFLAGASITPAMVFMAMDPLSPSAWGTAAGVGIVGAIAWIAVATLPKLDRRPTHWIALGIAWAALPLNATGALSLATWFGQVRNAVGV